MSVRDICYELMALGQMAGCRGKRYSALEIMAEATAEIIRLTAELAGVREERDALKDAALGVIAHMEGRLPIRGWIRDNNHSRDALDVLVKVAEIRALPAEKGEKG